MCLKNTWKHIGNISLFIFASLYLCLLYRKFTISPMPQCVKVIKYYAVYYNGHQKKFLLMFNADS